MTLKPPGAPYAVTLRLCIWLLLSADPGQFMLTMALVCTSMVAVNKGTNKRSALTPFGDEDLSYVAAGNTLLERHLS